MRFLRAFLLVALFLVATRMASAGEDQHPLPTPIMRTVDPETVKAGAIATVLGEYLDKSRVSEVYITDGTTDLKVEILEQKASALKFRVPANAAAGRYNMMVLLVSIEPKLIEEPARLKVE